MGERAISLHGKTTVVTGASSGIGYETALALARFGARVVLVCRDRVRGEAAQQQIVAASGNTAVDLLIADLASLEAVRTLASELQTRYTRIDVLVNNAGVFDAHRIVTVDGFERMLAVNHLAPFLLTNLLVDTLRASAPARVINVSSGSHRVGRIDFDDLQCERDFSPVKAYARSKLASLICTYELARRLDGTGVTVNAADPGNVGTKMTRGRKDMPWFVRLIFFLSGPFATSAEVGAAASIYLATSPEVAQVTGGYFHKQRAERSAPASYDLAIARRLWDASAALTGLVDALRT